MLNRSIVSACCAMALTGDAAAAATGAFEALEVARGFDAPTSVAPTPDGGLFVAEQGGAIWRVAADGTRGDEPVVTLEVYAEFESGLLGLTADPNFSDNGLLYAFASVSDDEQHMIRIDTTLSPPAVVVLRDSLPGSNGVHVGGGIAFGPDGRLYVTIGDTGHPEFAQQVTSLAGKLCRFDRNGDVPDDNPFTTPTGAPRAYIALGFRNPYRFCFAPDGRMFVMDVGSSGDARREEINLIRPGDNAGWPDVEGAAPADRIGEFTDPIYSYVDEGAAITGCVYYSGDQFPPGYAGDLFHVEFVLNKLYRLTLDGDVSVAHEQVLDLEGGPVDLQQEAAGTLVYCEFFGGRVMRVRSTIAAETDQPNHADVGDADDLPRPSDDDAAPEIEDVAAAPPAPSSVCLGVGFAMLLSCAGLMVMSVRR